MALNKLDFLNEKIEKLKSINRYRSLQLINKEPCNIENSHFNTDDTANASPNRSIILCSNDYLGLSRHHDVIAGAITTTSKYGSGSGSSRLISGELSCYAELEDSIADFLGMESALLFPSGYQANIGLITALSDSFTTIISDELNHASIIDGCRLSKANVIISKHLDMQDISNKLNSISNKTGPRLIVAEGVFSMDGDISDIAQLRNIANEYNALLIIDDAHAIGVLGDAGRGIGYKMGEKPSADVIVGTFGKALGSSGAFVAGPKILREVLINLARTFIFTTGPNPAAIGAGYASLDLIKTNQNLIQKLRDNIIFFKSILSDYGFKIEKTGSSIFPIVIGSADATLVFAERLQKKGIFVRAIRPPTVKEGTSRLRLTVSATHSLNELEYCAKIIYETSKEMNIV